MSSGLFDDPRKWHKAHAANMVVPESEIRRAIQHSNKLPNAAKFINVSEHRFKHWAGKYLDADTGLTLLELQQRARLLEKANSIGSNPEAKKANNYDRSVKLTEKEIRDAMEITRSNKEAAIFLDVSKQVWKKYASMYVDEETGMTLYELQYEKWRKINYERFIARKDSGYFEKIAARKKAFEEARFKPGHQIADEHKYKGLQLSEETVRAAIKNTRSNREAAEWLRITYRTWKKYASKYTDPITGRTLFECHIAEGGKGIPKVQPLRRNKANPRAIELGYQLIKGQYYTPKRVNELAARLMKDGRLGYCCAECGFAQKRPIDMKMPLMLSFSNGDRTDWREENLRWLCYNCSFLLSLDSFSKAKRDVIQSIAPESPDAPDDLQSFYKIDDFYLEHLRNLGVKDLAEEVKPQEKDHKNPSIEDLIDYK
jgi:hypothetical protein